MSTDKPGFRYPIGTLLVITTDNNRQNGEGITKGTLCVVFAHENIFDISSPHFPGKVNYQVRFLPEDKWQDLNECGPFIFEDEMTWPTPAAEVLYGS